MCNDCCCGYGAYFAALNQLLEKIACDVNTIACNINDPNVADIKRMLAQPYPMTVAAEYPTIKEDKIVVVTNVNFLEMLNINMYVMFKVNVPVTESDLPLYFKDKSNYEHRIVDKDNNPIKGNQIILNGIYKAYYQQSASAIILDNIIPINPNII